MTRVTFTLISASFVYLFAFLTISKLEYFKPDESTIVDAQERKWMVLIKMILISLVGYTRHEYDKILFEVDSTIAIAWIFLSKIISHMIIYCIVNYVIFGLVLDKTKTLKESRTLRYINNLFKDKILKSV